ncbi:M23 family metallopeptidase [Desulfococcus sp.]|uniref:M23 family metallopeptidase n=1 Tax=Desulfococcus sp. TaxID=2025834 RepID=UPI003593E950
MKNRIVFQPTNSRREAGRRVTVSRFFLGALVFLATAFFTAFGYLIMEYLHLRAVAREAVILELRLADQNELLESQQEQIQLFAGELSSLKDKLVSLGEFGRKVREMVDMAPGEALEDPFGIGGSSPADLNPFLDPNARRTEMMRRMQEHVVRLSLETDIQQEDFSTLMGALKEQRNFLVRTPSVHPVKGPLSSTFGTRRSPFTGEFEFHKGIDIVAATGTPVAAPADGRISIAEYEGSYGKIMAIDHGYGVVTRFAHLSAFLKRAGESVKRGEAVALVGNTGRSTGPHLHYEVHLNGIPVDPQDFLMGSDGFQVVLKKKQ